MPRGRNIRIIGMSEVFTCECGYETASATGMRLHRRFTHSLDVRNEPCETVFRCNTCKIAFENGFQLNTHFRHTCHSTQ
jgi:hypothetical protein